MSATLTRVAHGALTGSALGAAIGLISGLVHRPVVPLEVVYTVPSTKATKVLNTLNLDIDVPVPMLLTRIRRSIEMDHTIPRSASVQLNIVIYQFQRFFSRLAIYRENPGTSRAKVELRHQGLKTLKSIAALETLVCSSREAETACRSLMDLRTFITSETLAAET